MTHIVGASAGASKNGQNNCPNPPAKAQKAIMLHVSGIQVGLLTGEFDDGLWRKATSWGSAHKKSESVFFFAWCGKIWAGSQRFRVASQQTHGS